MSKMIDNDILVSNKIVYNLQYTLVNWFRIATIIVVVLYLIGFFSNVPVGFLELNFIFKLLIAVFLLYRFNRYRNKIVVTDLDKEAAYIAGEYLLIVAFVDILSGYSDKLRPIVLSYTKPIVEKMKQIF